MDIQLRSATAADREFLYQLHVATMRAYVEQTWGAWDEAWQRHYFDQYFEPSSRQIIQVAGVDVGVWMVEHREHKIFLATIQLLPAYQRQGIATVLIEQLKTKGQQAHLPVVLRVLTVNPARVLYERLGFAVFDATDTHYYMKC